jgi:hypothetical protein
VASHLTDEWDPDLSGIRRAVNTPEEAEQFCAQVMSALGLTNARVTAGGPDGGIDVESNDMVAQVKHHMTSVGRPDVQRLVGAAEGRRCLFFSMSGYSGPALDYADGAGMILLQYSTGGDVGPVNARAGSFLAGVDMAEHEADKRVLEAQALLLWANHSLLAITDEMDRISSYLKPNRRERTTLRKLEPLVDQLRHCFDDLDRLVHEPADSPRLSRRRDARLEDKSREITTLLTRAGRAAEVGLPDRPR